MKRAGVIVAVLASCSLESKLSETVVPGTDLNFVLFEDEKKMRRYHISMDGAEISEEGFLGPHDSDAPREPTIIRGPDAVKLEWRGSRNTQFVSFDIAACRIIQHSNSHAQPPNLERCRI